MKDKRRKQTERKTQKVNSNKNAGIKLKEKHSNPIERQTY